MGRWRRTSRRSRSRSKADLETESSATSAGITENHGLDAAESSLAPSSAGEAGADGSSVVRSRDLTPPRRNTSRTPPRRNTSGSLVYRTSSSSMGAADSFDAPLSATSSMSDVDSSSGHGSGATRRHSHQRKPYRGKQAFTSSERERIRRYLEAYRDGAERVCFGEHDYDDDDVAVVGGGVPNWCRAEGGIWISGHHFPPLTEDVLGQPFLSLPAGLGSKQRKIVHEICVDVGLFHCGAGDRRIPSGRRVVVSIHADGLEYVHNLTPPIGFPIRQCTPWFYRNDHPDDADGENDDEGPGGGGGERGGSTPVHSNVTPSMRYVERATKKGREVIQSFIDQPGRCLRDAHDSIDFTELEGRDLSEFPTPMGERSSWTLVDTADKMRECVREVEESQPSALGFDLEMYNQSMYNQSTCLIQLSTDQGKDYVIDVLAPGVWDTIPLLAPIFADPSVVKVGHAIGGMDVPSLHRDFGIFVVNAFDTYEAARVLHLKHANLASVCEHYGLRTSREYAALKKEYQVTDWRRRPLSEDMIRYGLYDAHYLVELRSLLIRDITRGKLWDDAGVDREEEARIVARALAATMRAAREYDDEEDGKDGEDGGGGDKWEQSTQSSESSDDDGYFTPTEDVSFDEAVSNSADSGEDRLGEDGHPSSAGDGGGRRRKRRSVFRAKELRMHAELMKVITISQDRCLGLWKGKEESHMKNNTLISLMRRTAGGNGNWNGSHMSLYQMLIQWRKEVAAENGIMPAQVCPLDLLVLIAYKRPGCESNLRRLSYFLPEFLDSDAGKTYVDQIMSMVRTSFEEGEEVSDLLVRSYAARVKTAQRSAVDGSGHSASNGSTPSRREGKKSNAEEHSEDEGEISVNRGIGKDSSVWRRMHIITALAVTVAALGALVLVGVIRKKKR